MKGVFSPALALCLAISTLPRDPGQPSAAQVPLQGHLADARRVVRRGGRSVEELKGELISDAAAKYVRFNGNARAFLEVAYDHITAMHYEAETKRPRTLLNAQTAHYLTIFYSDAAGQGSVATFRLPERDAASVLDRLETDTGSRINRTPAKQSFQGLPIRVAVGDSVVVIDTAGQTTNGPITHLSALSVVVNGSTPAEHEFAEGSVRRISLALPDKRAVASKAKWWAGIGAVVGGLYGGAFGGVAGVLEGAMVFGAMWGVIGAGMNAVSAAPADSDVYIGSP